MGIENHSHCRIGMEVRTQRYTHTHTHRAPCTRHAFHFSVRSIEDAEGARTQLLCLPTA